MLEALTLCTMNTERYRALILDALQCQENEGSRKTDEGQPIGRDQRGAPCHGRECPNSLPSALLLFITAGMVVERKPCVRGEKE